MIESEYTTKALAALETVAQLGEDRERRETSRSLMDALERTRRESGRVF